MMTRIDGKQRLTSIRRFMDGEIPFKPIGTSQQFFFKQPADDGAKRRTSKNLLPTSYRRAFEHMQITCIEYRSLREEQERDIFQRVQLGIALTPAEKMQAVAGPWPAFVQQILKQYVFGEGALRDLIVSDFLRARGYSNVLSALMICHALPRSDHKVSPSVTRMTAFLKRTDSPPAALKQRFTKAFEAFLDIAKNHHKEAFETVSAVKVAPVEFTFIAVLIYTLLPQYQDDVEFIASKISQMRLHLRKSHVDVRANSKVMNDCHAFIDSISKTNEKKRSLSLDDDSDQDQVTGKGKRGKTKVFSERSQVDPLTAAPVLEAHGGNSVEGKDEAARPAEVRPERLKEQQGYPQQPIHDQLNGVSQ